MNVPELDGAAMFRCLAFEKSDTPFLVLADWLEEQGKPEYTARAHLIRAQIDARRAQRSTHCWQCGSTLWQRSNWSGPDVARCLACHITCGTWAEVCQAANTVKSTEVWASLFNIAHRDSWRKGPACEKCQGKGAYEDVEPDCDTSDIVTHHCHFCFGTGDIGGIGGTEEPMVCNLASATVYVASFNKIVQICHECGGVGVELQAAPDRGPAPVCKRCNGALYKPSRWLSQVLTHHPDVHFVVAADKQPVEVEGQWKWYDHFAMTQERIASVASTIPRCIMPHVLDAGSRLGRWTDNSQHRAIQALAAGVILWAKQWQ